MTRTCIVLLALGAVARAAGADPTNLPPIIVTASRGAEPVTKVAASTDTHSATALGEAQTRTLPEALNRTTGVMVQKTSYGQGSPYIRGFTGFRTLMLVDGIRLNTPVFREGANQYWNTVDLASLDTVELLKGPGSALYGSDAIGGTVQAFTRMPEYAPDCGEVWGGRLATRVASAERSVTGRAEGEYGTDLWAGLFGMTYKKFGDLEGGRRTGRQRRTGYRELDLDAKVRLNLKGDRELILAHYEVDQDDVWRTHRTPYGISWHGTAIGTERRHVFDQARSLSYLRYVDRESTALYDDVQATLYFQRQEETKDVVKSSRARTVDGFDVQTWGAAADLTKETPAGTWAYGAEYVRDGIDSFRRNYRADGSLSSVGIQGPVADRSAYHTAAAYLQDRVNLADRWELTLGGRATYARADIGRYENFETSPHTPASMDAHWYDVSGFARLSCRVIDHLWWLYASASQGFRAPGLSDLTRFDVSRSTDIETPSTNLDPETFVGGEVGSRIAADPVTWHVAYFYTRIRDMIVRQAAGGGTYTKINGGDGYVHGVESELDVRLGRRWLWRSGFTWIEGYTDYDGPGGGRISEPVRTLPLTVYAALRWESGDRRFWAEALGRASAREDRLTAADREDTQRIPPGGTPGFAVADLRFGFRCNAAWSLVAACENVMDKDYRIHGSGSNEPGRNLVLSAEYRF
ncbi:MAG TPA: TonB-dependent receptor [Kiritimatiellia bacterium]|nr:TonB-dependent receptor [Kiritimatiellia bacterium]